jgi:hypothetical protein
MGLPLGATGSHASWAALTFTTVYKSVFCSGQFDSIDHGNGRGYGATVNYVDADGTWHGDEHIQDGVGLFDANLWDPENPIRQPFAHPVLLAGASAADFAKLNQYFWWAATGKVDEQLPPQTQPESVPGSPDGGAGNASGQASPAPEPEPEPAPPPAPVKKKKRH